jgi:hypothetical protein
MRDSLATAYHNVLEQLPGRIRAWATRVAPPEPVCALILVFSIENPDPAPTLTLGRLAELPTIRAHDNRTGLPWRVFSAMYFELQEAFRMSSMVMIGWSNRRISSPLRAGAEETRPAHG